MDQDKRSESRSATSVAAKVRANGELRPCHLRDISFKGAQIACEPSVEKGQGVTLMLEPFGNVAGQVMWNSDNASGIQFNDRAETIEGVVMGLAALSVA